MERHTIKITDGHQGCSNGRPAVVREVTIEGNEYQAREVANQLRREYDARQGDLGNSVNSRTGYSIDDR